MERVTGHHLLPDPIDGKQTEKDTPYRVSLNSGIEQDDDHAG